MPRLRADAWRLALLVCGLVLAGSAGAVGGVFKWVDRYGATRYDDQSLFAERMTRASIARGGVAADAKATVSADFVDAVAEQCADLKDRSNSYAQAREVFGRDPGGNVYRFSRNQVALEVAYLDQQSHRYCRPLAAQYVMAELREQMRRRDAPGSASGKPRPGR